MTEETRNAVEQVQNWLQPRMGKMGVMMQRDEPPTDSIRLALAYIAELEAVMGNAEQIVGKLREIPVTTPREMYARGMHYSAKRLFDLMAIAVPDCVIEKLYGEPVVITPTNIQQCTTYLQDRQCRERES